MTPHLLHNWVGKADRCPEFKQMSVAVSLLGGGDVGRDGGSFGGPSRYDGSVCVAPSPSSEVCQVAAKSGWECQVVAVGGRTPTAIPSADGCSSSMPGTVAERPRHFHCTTCGHATLRADRAASHVEHNHTKVVTAGEESLSLTEVSLCEGPLCWCSPPPAPQCGAVARSHVFDRAQGRVWV
jgi:hypothetical protein